MSFLKIVDTVKGRAVRIAGEKELYISRKYNLYSYKFDARKTELVVKAACPGWRKMIEMSRLLCRLFRHEIRSFIPLPDGGKILATRQWVYYSLPDQIELMPAKVNAANVIPPMCLNIDSNGRIFWGEYWSDDVHPKPIRLFVSEDKGKTYEPVLGFNAREILHIHSVVEDVYDNCYWLFTGDHDNEPGIARLSKDLKSMDWLVRGQQKYRAVNAFVFKDTLVYGTDSEVDYNGIYAISKSSGRLEKLSDTPGSTLFTGRFGKWFALSTGVEYFRKFKQDKATLWLSKDGFSWQQVFEATKDIWSKKYFQFGGIVLPAGNWNRNEIVFSGRAVKQIDNVVCVAHVIES